MTVIIPCPHSVLFLVQLDSNVQVQAAEGTLSAKLKRQKLGQMYPGIDSTVLDDIFQSTGYSLEATTYTIQDSTGDSPAPTQTIYHGKVVSDAEYEDILVKQAIDESLENKVIGRILYFKTVMSQCGYVRL